MTGPPRGLRPVPGRRDDGDGPDRLRDHGGDVPLALEDVAEVRRAGYPAPFEVRPTVEVRVAVCASEALGGRHVLGAGQEIELGAWYPEQGAQAQVQLGIRPDFVTVSNNGGVAAQVTRVEDLGRVRLARVRLGGHDLVATMPHGARIEGDEAHLRFDPANALIYANDRLVQGRTQ